MNTAEIRNVKMLMSDFIAKAKESKESMESMLRLVENNTKNKLKRLENEYREECALSCGPIEFSADEPNYYVYFNHAVKRYEVERADVVELLGALYFKESSAKLLAKMLNK